MSNLHKDDDPISCCWMILLEGKKRFYLMPPTAEKKIKSWYNKGPVFISNEKVLEARKLGLFIADL